MQLSKDGKLIRTDIWREGDYLDLWSVPHFLSGIAVAFSLYFFGFATNAAFTIAFLVLVAYEMFEVIAKIEETRFNRVLDVVVGMASFALTFLLAPIFSQSYTIVLFVVVTVADAVLSFFGWQASRKAYVLEQNLRAEFEKEKEKFTLRRKALTKNWRKRRDRWRERHSDTAPDMSIGE